MLKLLRVSMGSLAQKPVVAGLETDNSRIVCAAPILKKYIGLTEEKFREVCRIRTWRIEEVK